MNRREMLKILLQLAEGVNPETGEILHSDSPYQSALITRALFQAVRELERHGGAQRHEPAGKLVPEEVRGDGRYEEPSPARQALNRGAGLPNRAYAPWSEQEDDELRRLHGQALTVQQLAQHFGRKSGAIKSRLAKLGLG